MKQDFSFRNIFDIMHNILYDEMHHAFRYIHDYDEILLLYIIYIV